MPTPTCAPPRAEASTCSSRIRPSGAGSRAAIARRGSARRICIARTASADGARPSKGCAPRSPDSHRRQHLLRVDGLSLAAHLEVQLHLVGIGGAHLGDLLALAHVLLLFHENVVVV